MGAWELVGVEVTSDHSTIVPIAVLAGGAQRSEAQLQDRKPAPAFLPEVEDCPSLPQLALEPVAGKSLVFLFSYWKIDIVY